MSKYHPPKPEDVELLKLAAKAIGCTAHRFESVGALFLFEPNGCTQGEWSPLHDDGDALRLAKSCRMVLDWSNGELHVRFWKTDCEDEVPLEFTSSDCGGDNRCIVRAAAEIGKAMP